MTFWISKVYLQKEAGADVSNLSGGYFGEEELEGGEI